VGYLWCVVVEYSFGMTTSTSASIQTSYQELQKVQKEIGKLFNNKQILTAQLRENELVKTEVDLLDESSTIYKLVGPVMVTQVSRHPSITTKTFVSVCLGLCRSEKYGGQSHRLPENRAGKSG